MSDYARDPQGRPISEDGNWVWNGTDWETNQAATPGSEPQGTYVGVTERDPESSYLSPDAYDPEPVREADPAPGGVAVEPIQSSYRGQHAAQAVDVIAPSVPAGEPIMDFRPAIAEEEEESDFDLNATFPTSANGGYVPAVSSRPSLTTTSVSDADEMSLGRLAATTAGVVLALGGALMLGVSIATILIMRAFQSAMEEAMTTGNADAIAGGGPSSGNGTIAMIYGVSFVVATLAAFSVLYAARVPKAIIGAAAIVVLSFAAFYGIDKSGVELQSWTGIALLPLVPAIATAGFIKWATR